MMWYYCTCTETAKIKTATTDSVKNVEGLHFSYIAAGNLKWYTLENSMATW
jgi:hypothetical protein